jgi:hypothetical protein
MGMAVMPALSPSFRFRDHVPTRTAAFVQLYSIKLLAWHEVQFPSHARQRGCEMTLRELAERPL